MQPNKQTRGWKLLAILGVVAGVLALLLGTASLWVSPILSSRLSAVARARFGSELHFQTMTVSLFPHLSVKASNVVFRQHGRTDVPPLFTIDHVYVQAGYAGLIGPYRRAHRMVFEGLHITVPPRDPNAARARLPQPHAGDRFIADEMIADGTVLTILPSKAGKEPLTFQIHKLTLRPGGQAAMHYNAELNNAKPPGLIRAEGDFGPWYNEDPGGTPLDGKYTFTNADLSVFRGISGTLSSTGQFAGDLQAIRAEGTTDTPDFALRDANHPVRLTTEFHATIDGRNGETLLQPVNAQFLHTRISCQGGVVQEDGQQAKTIDLDGVVQNGRLEDVLYLATKSQQPMTGVLSFDSKIVIPPGDIDVVRKLLLDGRAMVEQVRFTNPEVQQKLDEISARAEGHPKEASRNVESALRARFSMKNGSIQFSSLSFTLPGAEIALTGTYGIINEGLDFTGHARTEAKLSQMTTGYKRVILKAVDPFFKKDGAGAVLPVHITGTRQHPSFGL